MSCLSSDLYERIIRQGPNEQTIAFLDKYEVSRIVGSSGQTLLHYCALYGKDIVATYLLQRGCQPDARNHAGLTPIMLAILHNHDTIVQILLPTQVDLLAISPALQKSVLQMAFEAPCELSETTISMLLHKIKSDCSSHQQLLDVLISSGCQVYHAIHLKDVKLLEMMLAAGRFVDWRHPSRGYSALHMAVPLLDLPIINLLLDRGADPLALDSRGQNALFYLYNYNSDNSPAKLQVLQILLQRKVAVMSLTCSGFFQIAPLLSRACSEAIGMLFKCAHIDFKLTDAFEGQSVLHYLATNKNPGVVLQLMAHAKHLKINALDIWDASPLYYAAEDGNLQMLKFLLEAGADVEVRQKSAGYTPLYVAVLKAARGEDEHEDYNRCVDLLLQHGADPEACYVTTDKRVVSILEMASPQQQCQYYPLHSVIAQLALRHRKGMPVSELFLCSIQDDWFLYSYFQACLSLLASIFYPRMSIFQLLTAKDKTVAMLLRKHDKFLQNFRSFATKHQQLYPYYFGILQKRIKNLLCRMTVQDRVNNAICRIFNRRLNCHDCVVEKIFTYLDNASLFQLCRL